MTTLNLHSESLQTGWLDGYGHLNEVFYLVPFSNATWKVQDHFGIGLDYFNNTGCAIYTVETHMRYLREVHAPAELNISTEIFGADQKRIWFAHQMYVDDTLRATAEFMALHYSTRDNKTVPMPESVQQALLQFKVTELPEWAGRQLSLK